MDPCLRCCEHHPEHHHRSRVRRNDFGIPLTSQPAPGPGAIIGYILLGIWGLATIVPSLALVVRRLHDGNFSGWLVLIVLVPFLGALALLVFMILGSNPAGQRFDQPASA